MPLATFCSALYCTCTFVLVVFVFKRFLLKVGRVDDASDACEYVQYFGEIDLKLRDLVQLMQYSAWFSFN